MKFLKYVGIFILFVVAAIFGMTLLAPDEVSFRVNYDINAPIERVYKATTNHTEFKHWISGVEATRQIEGEGVASGASYDLTFAGEGNMVMRHKAKVVEPNARYAYMGTVKDFMEVSSDTKYIALDSANTRLTTKISMKTLSNKMKVFMYSKETHIKNATQNYERLRDYLVNE